MFFTHLLAFLGGAVAGGVLMFIFKKKVAPTVDDVVDKAEEAVKEAEEKLNEVKAKLDEVLDSIKG